MAEFLVPILDFVPEKRPTAAQLLLHPWLDPSPRIQQPSESKLQPSLDDAGVSDKEKREQEDEREAMAVGLGNIAIDGSSSKKMKDENQSSSSSSSSSKPNKTAVGSAR